MSERFRRYHSSDDSDSESSEEESEDEEVNNRKSSESGSSASEAEEEAEKESEGNIENGNEEEREEVKDVILKGDTGMERGPNIENESDNERVTSTEYIKTTTKEEPVKAEPDSTVKETKSGDIMDKPRDRRDKLSA